MRLFFRHVAPRLIGESTLRSSRNRSHDRGTKQSRSAGGLDADDSQYQSELRTIGSRVTKMEKYERVEDDGVSVESEERMGAGWRADRDSERGIVVKEEDGGGIIRKTSSVVIESEVWEEGKGGVRQNVTRVR